jgi:hypothetical protein
MPNKKTKKEVDYSKGMAKAHCSICANYIFYKHMMAKCEVVNGSVEPDMWCKLFEKKK